MAMKNSSIKAVVFDLGRVLVDVDLDGLSCLLPDHMRSALRTPASIQSLPEQFVRFNTGHLTPEEFHQWIRQWANLDLGYPQFVKVWQGVIKPKPGMEQIFKKVARTWAVGLLSDTDPLHWSHVLDNYPWIASIPAPTLSFQIGHIKPDPRCYLAAARNVGQEPAKCLFIDDREENVAGARQVGMLAERFEGPEKLRRRLFTLL